MNIIPKLTNLWDDPKIKAIDGGITQKMVRGSVGFNGEPPNMLDFLDDIEVKNENLDTLHWRIYSRKKVQGGKTIIFIGIDEASVGVPKEINFRPYYETGRIQITGEQQQLK